MDRKERIAVLKEEIKLTHNTTDIHKALQETIAEAEEDEALCEWAKEVARCYKLKNEATKWKVHEIMKLAEASAEKNVDKTCTAGTYGQCQYRYMNGALSYGCKYAGYCDYQLPKDSRQLGKVVKTERICPASPLHQQEGRRNEEN